jgi:hypothetical protein
MNPDAPAGALPFPAVPAVIFPHWREMLNRSGLPDRARAGYAQPVGCLGKLRREKISSHH